MRLPVVATTVVAAIGLVCYILLRAPSPHVVDPATATSAPMAVSPNTTTDATHRAARVSRRTKPLRPLVGITVPGLTSLDRFIAATSTVPRFVGIFQGWGTRPGFPRQLADAVAAKGSRLSITWEPWHSRKGTVDQPRYSLSSIIAGTHDHYIDSYARAVKRYPHPVNIRLMHEMNGFWYPWARGVNGNKPGQYVRAWRHVHDRFARVGVTNVRWMWAPNAVFPGAAGLTGLYPGPAYVDRVGIDNYNWGDRTHDGVVTRWRSFRALFQPTIRRLRHVTHRPVWISEVGSLNVGGSKAAWISQMFSTLRNSGDIAGVMWFDIDDTNHRADWRIENQPDAARAWARGVHDRH
jgi:mannan endo-1,4-beta-mannosidase